MKKKILFLFVMMFLMPLSVFADKINSIDIDIYIAKDGTASIVETWDVQASSGTEWYKTMYELNNSTLTDYKVFMDDRELTYKECDSGDSLTDKKGYYWIKNTSDGMELCFGKSDYKKHTFKISYKLSNYIFNTNDSQVLAWVITSETTVDLFTATISSFYVFPDNLEVWGYGYKGYAYVEDGVIKIENEKKLTGEYVSVLVKFPLGTFDNKNTDSRYDNFDDVYRAAEKGTFDYNYNNVFKQIINFIINNIVYIIIFGYIILAAYIRGGDKYGYVNNKKIDKKNVEMFRDIPCNKDIYYANALIKLNNFGYKESNIFGAIILKWVREKKVSFKKGEGKNNNIIDLTLNPIFDNEYETKLFDIMYRASKDGYLETKEMEKWCKKNYSKFLDIFKKIENDNIRKLREEGHIYRRKNKKECSKKNVMDDVIYQDSVELYGLKKFLVEFSNMKTKEVMDVHLWDEYLMFAYLFGIADEVAKQLKNLYPEVIQEIYGNGVDLDTLIFISYMSKSSVSIASSARAAASRYSSGGGGFSSGGGGGFSGGFSGGGGGSVGGR